MFDSTNTNRVLSVRSNVAYGVSVWKGRDMSDCLGAHGRTDKGNSRDTQKGEKKRCREKLKWNYGGGKEFMEIEMWEKHFK